MDNPTRELFIPGRCLQPAGLDRQLDRVIVDLIKIHHDSILEIGLVAKRHVHEKREP